ncbi:MAG TPA: DinB family protein [Thermoanaerobaculia bacterium]|nr:DinB family protein [Thermoanaerobaculia bacterium]
MTQPPISDPSSKEDLLRDFAAVRAWSEAFWLGFPSDEFFEPLGEAWSPADNVRHLIKSNRPLEKALGFPKLMILVRFWVSKGRSRRYSEVVGTYKEALGGGLTAGRFSPRPLEPGETTPEMQKRLVADLGASLDGIAAATRRWSERQLDWLRMPHPGLGLLSVREMLFFTLYHQTHHAGTVAKKKGLSRSA